MKRADALQEILDILIDIDARLQSIERSVAKATPKPLGHEADKEWVQKPRSPRDGKYLYPGVD